MIIMEKCDWCAGIAIVEDEKDLVRVYVRLFERRGIPVCFIAYDGDEAILKFIECSPKPHVVIMDYRLPTMNGIEVTRRILEIDPDTKIIFLSADISVKEEALKAGAFTFLAKPVSLNVITNAVDTIIKNNKDIKF
jgi:two-component system, chemotaxis family, chemotaxis protein CheY